MCAAKTHRQPRRESIDKLSRGVTPRVRNVIEESIATKLDTKPFVDKHTLRVRIVQARPRCQSQNAPFLESAPKQGVNFRAAAGRT
ncbi:MAG: hypothetical protein EAZ24_06640 [Burkholderiales bacterium]|nr:MAG: hypothetical protein EAZ24_06640 [Burkholderiales bacterium]TAG80946.1 MAG: hypothetical protein EAZ21_07205 [Betaproteobacteria bacterium]